MRRRRGSSEKDQTSPTGSPLPGEPVFLAIGRIRRPHGVEGEVVFEVMTDFPERIRAEKQVYVGPSHRIETIVSVRRHDPFLLIRFDGFTTPEQSAILRNEMVYVRADSLPKLPEGQYYHHDLVGLSVVDEAGNAIGVLSEILVTGANDVYAVRTEMGEEVLLAAIEEVVLEVDLANRKMVVRKPEWYS